MAEGAAKAISERRDRAQSRALVVGAGLLLAVEALLTLRTALSQLRVFPAFAGAAIGISLAFAALVRVLRAATAAGAAFGGVLCFVVTYRTGWLAEPVWRSALLPLACLFALTFVATRAGRVRKAQAGLAEKRSGRNAAQVVANLLAAAIAVSPAAEWLLRRGPAAGGLTAFAAVWVMAALKTACLAALVEATVDTMSSEIGQAFGGRPVLLAGFRRVEPGTDGAVSLGGTAAGLTGGAVVAGMGTWAMHLDGHSLWIAFASGVVGTFTDSVLGATVERRGWIGNDLVNFTSTMVAAVLAGLWMRQ